MPGCSQHSRCPRSSCAQGGPSPAPAPGDPEPRAPTCPCAEQSEAGAVDAALAQGRAFMGVRAGGAGAAHAGGTWHWGPSPCPLLGWHRALLLTGSPGQPQPTLSAPAITPLGRCHLMGQMSPAAFSLSALGPLSQRGKVTMPHTQSSSSGALPAQHQPSLATPAEPGSIHLQALAMELCRAGGQKIHCALLSDN